MQGWERGGNQVPILMESIPKVYDVNAAKELDRANTLDTSCRGVWGKQNGTVVYSLEGNGSRESHHGPGFTDNDKMYTLNIVEHHAVAQPVSTTGGQVYAIGNGQTAQLKMSEKVGTLNCMHDQIAIMQQLVTENKQLEACAPMTDEDSTDRMSHKES